MLRSFATAVVQHKRTSLTFLAKKNFLTKNVDNTETVAQFLTENKTLVDKTVFETFTQMVADQQRVFLFKIHGFSNFFFLSARFQAIGLTIGSIVNLAYFFPMKKAKLAENNAANREKKTKLYFATYSLCIFSVAVNIVTYLMARRYLKSINFLPQTNQLEFNFYGFIGQDKPYLIGLNQVHRVQKKLKDTTVQFQVANKDCPHTYFSSLGTGWWSNKKLFEYIVDQNPPLEVEEKEKPKKIPKMKKESHERID